MFLEKNLWSSVGMQEDDSVAAGGYGLGCPAWLRRYVLTRVCRSEGGGDAKSIASSGYDPLKRNRGVPREVAAEGKSPRNLKAVVPEKCLAQAGLSLEKLVSAQLVGEHCGLDASGAVADTVLLHGGDGVNQNSAQSPCA